jgi:PAS domain S-box-containing protein
MDSPIRLLHVDDEPDLADLTATFLEREDDRFSVETATSAGEGMDRLTEADIDCIVSDYDMPDRNGIEFLETVREGYPDLPFILYTGKGSEGVASEAISADVTDYLQKETGTDQYAILANRVLNAVGKARAEQEAEQTRTHLQAIVENTNDAIITIDAESTIHFANPAVEDLFGYAPAALEGESLTKLMPPRHHDDHYRAVDRFLTTGERTIDWQSIELHGQHRDGHEVPLSISFGKFELDGDRRFIGIIRDISDRVQGERELREQKERFRKVTESIDEVVWMSDPEKEEMLYVNHTYEEIWGQSVESLYEDPTSFLDAIHPEDRDRVEQALEEQVTGGYDEEYRIVRPDGEVRWIHDRTDIVKDDTGEVYRIVGTASDITERKEHERELQRVRDRMEFALDATDAIVWDWNVDDDEASFYPSPETLFGTTVEDWDDFIDVVHPEDRQTVREAVEHSLETGEPKYEEIRINRDGDVRWIEAPGYPISDDDGTTQMIGVARDITDSKRTELELERQNEQLEEFASIVSHDLRNPLSIAAGRLELAQAECDSEHLDRAAQALGRMESLIEDLLRRATNETLFTRGAESVPELDSVELATAIETCWQNVATREATLVVETDQTIRADRSRLQQLFENLIRNAVEHGGPNVTVSIGDLDDRSGFYVADDGQGIPESNREQVFETGYSTAEDNVGVGLHIVKGIVDDYDWTIAATESDDGGARFEITDIELAQ